MWKFLRGISLTWWIVISMVVGITLGYLDNAVWTQVNLATWLQPLSTLFLRMIKSIVVPLIFGSLVVGVAGHGDDMKRVGRLAFKALVYFEIVTTVALTVGLLAVNLVKPGVGVSLTGTTESAAQLAVNKPTLAIVLEHTVPQSFFEAAAKNEVLQIVFFAIIFAVALSQVGEFQKIAGVTGYPSVR